MGHTLVVPDFHERVRLIPKLEKLEADAEKVVYLGDYFDTFKSTADTVATTIQFVQDRLAHPDKFTMLMGNHEAHYRWNRQPWVPTSPGYNLSTHTQIQNAGIAWSVMPLFICDRGYCLSHAGFHPDYLPNLDNEYALEFLQETQYKVIRGYDHNQDFTHPWILHGLRDGGVGYGGPLWLRWIDFEDVPGLPQIVGHTPNNAIRRKGTSICLDNGCRSVLRLWGTPIQVTIVNIS